MTVETGARCERCGLESNNGALRNHESLCSRLPLPDELLEEMKTASIKSIAKKYHVDYKTMRYRLMLSDGYDNVVDAKRQARSRKKKQPIRVEVKTKPTKKRRVKKGRRYPEGHCESCGAAFNHFDVYEWQRSGICAMCADERPKQREVSLLDYQPFVIEY